MKTFFTRKNAIFFIAFVFLFSISDVNAQRRKKKTKGKAPIAAPAKKPSKKKSIADLTKQSEKIEGLFTMYRDTVNGSLQMLISKDQLDKEFIYFSQVANGIVDIGAFKGAYGGSKVFKIKKFYDKIEFITENSSSYFDPDNALSKSADANISEAIMASEKIAAHDAKKGLYLIKADNLFLKETFSQIKPPRFPGQSPFAFSLGNLDRSKTKVTALRNYPKNTDLKVSYAYSKPSVLNGGSRGVTDGRNVTIKVYHSLIEMPDNNYKPRFDDPRVGFFTTRVTDMTSTSVTPYRDLVHRWYLEKKNPNAAISEPVEPITWWIENTTPKEIRPIIKKAGLQWNKSFEKAGFRNAIVIKEQPDDADWDAGDIRYNVLRWTSSPNPPFGGYGPSFVNPKTGQILGADIMLEYSSLAGNLRNEGFFNTIGFEMYLEDFEKEIKHLQKDPAYCSAGQYAQLNNMFAMSAIDVMEEGELEKSKMVEEFIHFLILHEMGHTLGLNHNMKSSQLHNLETINNVSITEEMGLYGSVMDYPAVNYANDRETQGNYWTKTPGPYDDWAVEFGYKVVNSDRELNVILEKSADPKLAFGNDADDMRAPGKAADPRVNVGDLTDDAIEYAMQRIKLSRDISKGLLKKYSKKGQSYQELLTSYFVVTGQQIASANTISRYIGGVYVDRAFAGQDGATKPYIPVELAKQKKAMKALETYVFAPDALKAPKDIYAYLQAQRRGYTGPQDPRIHSRILNMQRSVLLHILHFNTVQRILDSELYGNQYSLSSMMTDLNNAIFKADIYGNVNTARQNLQVEYTNMLIGALTGRNNARYTHAAKSMILYNLKSIRRMVTNTNGNLASKAHKSHLKTLIDNALKEVK
ncbi:DUF5117 domain-containing protein [Flavobacteriaceae bacterium R38]|nr:DUF5117 domain-containing protein [Flavobacteriaceae bacterium R38]